MALVKCDDCGGDVSSEATACPKCARPIAVAKPAEESDGSLVVLVLAPLLGAILCVIWLDGSMLLVAQQNLTMVVVMTIVATAGIAAWDATKPSATWNPAGAFFAVLLLFPLAFPIYLFTRRKLSYAIGGLLSMLVLCAVVGYYGKQIYDWQQRGREVMGALSSRSDTPTAGSSPSDESFRDYQLRSALSEFGPSTTTKIAIRSLGPADRETRQKAIDGRMTKFLVWRGDRRALTVGFRNGKAVSIDPFEIGGD